MLVELSFLDANSCDERRTRDLSEAEGTLLATCLQAVKEYVGYTAICSLSVVACLPSLWDLCMLAQSRTCTCFRRGV